MTTSYPDPRQAYPGSRLRRPLLALLTALLFAVSCAKHVDEAPPQGSSAEQAAKPTPASLSDREARVWYLDQVSRIGGLNEAWIREGVPVETRARRAYEIRHEARLEARALMQDRKKVEVLRARDQAKYGSPDGPTFEMLVEKARADGLIGDAIYESIIRSAQETNKEVDRRFGVGGG